MLIALTGTPGTGKATVATLLQDKGWPVVDVNDLAKQSGALTDYDQLRDSWDVDLMTLGKSISKRQPCVLAGHLSHLLNVDLTIVLRCHPETLRARLEARGWSAAKVGENVEAEAIGVISAEAKERRMTYEVDTTDNSPQGVARAVLEILNGEGESHLSGKIDWSEVILGWY